MKDRNGWEAPNAQITYDAHMDVLRLHPWTKFISDQIVWNTGVHFWQPFPDTTLCGEYCEIDTTDEPQTALNLWIAAHTCLFKKPPNGIGLQ